MKKNLLIILLLLISPSITLAIPVTPNNTKNLQNFWAEGYKAKWVSQTQAITWESSNSNALGIQDGDEYFDTKGSDQIEITTKFQNTGTETWFKTPEDRQVCINIYKDHNVTSSWSGKEKSGESDFSSANWPKPYRISCIEEEIVSPGGIGTFSMKFTIPADAPSGRFREDITLAAGPYWMESDKETADPIGAAHIWAGFNIFGYQEKVTVEKVIDGDTIKISTGKVIRYVGIDTPETVAPNKPIQCFGTEASTKNKELVEGKEVIIFGDPTADNIDKYDRLLRYVFLTDTKENISRTLVRNGFAYAYTKYPNHIIPLFQQDEAQAKAENLGLWAACSQNATPTPTPIITSDTPTPMPTADINTPIPQPTENPNPNNYSCGSKTYCTQMTSCEEAEYYLTQCGLSRLDGDGDGVPCETLCR
ncbi:MAG: thermonuclease family protein [bacterium]